MQKPAFIQNLLFLILLFLSGYAIAQPANNDCANAAWITTDSACVNGSSRLTGQTLQNATADNYAITSTCSHLSGARDIWYRFVAKSKNPTITISNQGSGWGGIANVRTQLLAGTCGSFTEIACGTGATLIPSLTNPLTPGTTYYIRIHKNTTTAIGTNHGFDICVTDPLTRASRMKEVFSRTVLSGASVMNNPWEVTYGPDNFLWVTESKGYRVYRFDPNTGARTTVLDIRQNSTFLPPADQGFNCQFNNGAGAQGGLAGLALHPNFMDGTANERNWVYISYVHTSNGGSAPNGIFFTNRLVRFTYNTGTNVLESPVSLCDTLPGSNDHNSQRMIIAPVVAGGPKYLFYASGDMGSGQGNNRLRPIKSQLPDSYEGKILRFNLDEDGDNDPDDYDDWIPNDNPYNTIVGKQSAVWNIGIRNNQGFAYDSVANIMYGSSHGAYSDDEINILQGFKNYGHPLIVGYADGNYDGTTTPGLSTSYSAGSPFPTSSGVSTCDPIGSETTRRTEINAMGYGDYVDPLFSAYVGDASGTNSVKHIWSNTPTPNNSGWPSEGWSGLDLYTNKVIPGWKQSLIASGLKWGRLIRLKLGETGTTTLPSNQSINNTSDTVLYLQSSNRYRDIAFGPNGKDIYVIMDNNAASVATDGNPPVTPACAGCLIKYTFLGYADNGGKSTIPSSIDVTAGSNNQCNPGTAVAIDGSNNYLWVPITGPDGNIMAEINGMGQNLGEITSSFYQHNGPIRVNGGVRYLNRSITISPAVTSFANPVKVRLYISKAEFTSLLNEPGSMLSDIGDLKILKNNDACISSSSSSFSVINPVNSGVDLEHGDDGYVLQVNVTSFSTFYFGSGTPVLPLDLLTFTGQLQPNNTVLLKWRTENEISTSNFEIERSVDGIAFSRIGNIAAAGNGSTIQQYSFVDNDAALQGSPVLYYRLKMIDHGGAYKYSNVISVTLTYTTGQITVMPNPVTSETRITITAPQDGQLVIRVVDNTGRVVITNSIYARRGVGAIFSIDMSRFASGSYYLQVSGAGMNSSQKIQKL